MLRINELEREKLTKLGEEIIMKRKVILPLNTTPLIKGQSYTLNTCAILTNDTLVGEYNACVKNIKIYQENIQIYPRFQMREREIKSYRGDSSIEFSSDPYVDKKYSVFFHETNTSASIEMTIDYIQDSNPWGSIGVFITENIGNLDSIEHEFDYFLRFYNMYGITASLYGNLQTIKNIRDEVNLRIKKDSNSIIMQYSSGHSPWQTGFESKCNYNGTYYIGLAYFPCENHVYNWIFSNFIQLCYRSEESAAPLDYFMAFPRWYVLTILNPFMHINTLPYSAFIDNSSDEEITKLILSYIDKGYYTQLDLNEFYIPGSNAYQNYQRDHISLVYGYDLDRQEFNILRYESLPVFETVGFKPFIQALKRLNKDYCNIISMYKYENYADRYLLDLDVMVAFLEDYLYGKNSCVNLRHYISETDKNMLFGLKYITELQSNQTLFERLLQDARIAYHLNEHKKVMIERLKFLLARKCINDTQFSLFTTEYQKIEQLYKQVLNLVIYRIQSGKTTKDMPIKRCLAEALDCERKVLPKLIDQIKTIALQNKLNGRE